MKPTRETRRAVLRTIGGATVFGAGTVASVSPTAAQPPVSGSGTGKITNLEVFPIREVGGNTFEDRILEGETLTGPLDGSLEWNISGKVHASGRVVFNGTMEFTGTLEDCGEGTINLGISGRGDIPEPGFPITEASARVINQPENTIDVTGTANLFQEGPDLTYDIQYNCKE